MKKFEWPEVDITTFEFESIMFVSLGDDDPENCKLYDPSDDN